MPKSPKTHKSAIKREMQKWVSLSQRIRTSGHISYGKIRSNLHALEAICPKEELNDLTNSIGKLFCSKPSI